MNNITVVLDNNNSGGRFWLKPEDVAKLLKVGWKLHGSRDARFRDEHDFGQYAENAGGMVDPRFWRGAELHGHRRRRGRGYRPRGAVLRGEHPVHHGRAGLRLLRPAVPHARGVVAVRERP